MCTLNWIIINHYCEVRNRAFNNGVSSNIVFSQYASGFENFWIRHVFLHQHTEFRQNQLINGCVMAFCWFMTDGIGGHLALSRNFRFYVYWTRHATLQLQINFCQHLSINCMNSAAIMFFHGISGLWYLDWASYSAPTYQNFFKLGQKTAELWRLVGVVEMASTAILYCRCISRFDVFGLKKFLCFTSNFIETC